MKFRVTFAGLLFVACAIAQGSDDSAMYVSFFREAAHRTEVAPDAPMMLNGVPVTYVNPTMEDTLGIASDEAHAIVQISLQCESAVNKLDASMSELIFESRLELADSGEVSEAVAAKLKELEAKRIQLILDHVQQMKTSLGDRFRPVDDYIRAHAGGGFFPINGPKKKL